MSDCYMFGVFSCEISTLKVPNTDMGVVQVEVGVLSQGLKLIVPTDAPPFVTRYHESMFWRRTNHSVFHGTNCSHSFPIKFHRIHPFLIFHNSIQSCSFRICRCHWHYRKCCLGHLSTPLSNMWIHLPFQILLRVSYLFPLPRTPPSPKKSRHHDDNKLKKKKKKKKN